MKFVHLHARPIQLSSLICSLSVSNWNGWYSNPILANTLMILLNALLSFPVREPTSPKMDTKGFVVKSISQALIYAVLYPDFSRYFCHILTNVVFPVPHDPFNAMVNPPSAQFITEVRILAKGSLSSLQFANGLSAGISGNEGLSFIVNNI